MNKSRLVVTIVCLFLVHSQVVALQDLGTLPLTPSREVSPTETNHPGIFLKEFNILAFALSVYYLDAKEQLSKEDIKEKLAGNSTILWEKFNIGFDMNNIDFKKRGFTRYYPFSVNGKDFIIRIFDANERHYLANFEILYEGVLNRPEIGFQIIPGINAILDKKKIEPREAAYNELPLGSS